MKPLINYLIDSRSNKVNNTLVFLHLQKCAGTTLQRIIEDQYDYDTWTRVADWKMRQKTLVFKGHFQFGEENKFLDSGISRTYITMLREPMDRVMSSFYYVRREPKIRVHEEFNQITFKKFLQKEDNFYYVFRHTNMMTRQLSGGDPNNLDGALENLHKFNYIGIAEEFNKSLELFTKALNWDNVKPYEKENVTDERPEVEDLSSEEIAILKQKNQNDIVLYEEAVKLFWNKYKQVVG